MLTSWEENVAFDSYFLLM